MGKNEKRHGVPLPGRLQIVTRGEQHRHVSIATTLRKEDYPVTRQGGRAGGREGGRKGGREGGNESRSTYLRSSAVCSRFATLSIFSPFCSTSSQMILSRSTPYMSAAMKSSMALREGGREGGRGEDCRLLILFVARLRRRF